MEVNGYHLLVLWRDVAELIQYSLLDVSPILYDIIA